jgi:hypothetical protein
VGWEPKQITAADVERLVGNRRLIPLDDVADLLGLPPERVRKACDDSETTTRPAAQGWTRVFVTSEGVYRLAVHYAKLGKLPRKGRPLGSSVYYVRMVNADGFIKIGVATSPESRLANMQVGSPYELELMHSEPGDETLEAQLHARFQHLHVRGEWFRPDPDLVNFIIARKRLPESAA